ncbi:MAG: hypothetical protein LBG19_09130 [Prevotellaceae bacterium]|jgi:hypothetical protein|nr:hypothetical protein [Prevotellaceae bacterium]
MKKLLSLLFLINGTILFAQKNYPYEPSEGNNSLNAYWYAVPTDSVEWQKVNRTTYFCSIVHAYGKVPEGDFTVKVKAYEKGDKFFDKNFDIKDGKSTDPNVKYLAANGYFRIESPTETGTRRADVIELGLESAKGTFSKSIPCTYHTISGHFTDFDGKPFKGFIRVSSDDFPDFTGVWSDDNGKYSITLPARDYNTFYADDHTYGISTLEYWGWRMIVDRDETLDIRIGNGEVYNLHAWSSNGGHNTYFLYFRPMVLPKALLPEEDYTSKQMIAGQIYEKLDIAPTLEEKDITVKLNGEKLSIISLQPVYETGKDSNTEHFCMPAYLVQVERPQWATGKKLTFEVSYDTFITVKGEKIRVNSMAHCQLYANISGLSEY